jgi:hypothetical protein
MVRDADRRVSVCTGRGGDGRTSGKVSKVRPNARQKQTCQAVAINDRNAGGCNPPMRPNPTTDKSLHNQSLLKHMIRDMQRRAVQLQWSHECASVTSPECCTMGWAGIRFRGKKSPDPYTICPLGS